MDIFYSCLKYSLLDSLHITKPHSIWYAFSRSSQNLSSTTRRIYLHPRTGRMVKDVNLRRRYTLCCISRCTLRWEILTTFSIRLWMLRIPLTKGGLWVRMKELNKASVVWNAFTFNYQSFLLYKLRVASLTELISIHRYNPPSTLFPRISLHCGHELYVTWYGIILLFTFFVRDWRLIGRTKQTSRQHQRWFYTRRVFITHVRYTHDNIRPPLGA